MHKTGSTSIQRTLHRNREALLTRHGVQLLDGIPNHTLYAFAYRTEPLNKHAMIVKTVGSSPEKIEAWKKACRETIRQRAADPAIDTLLISGEGFSTMRHEEAERLAEDLKSGGAQIDIYMYARHPFGFFLSSAQQSLKHGWTLEQIRKTSIQSKEDAKTFRRGTAAAVPNYRERAEKFAELFGRENVHIREFSPQTFAGGDASKDFLHWVFGIDADVENMAPVRANEGMDHASAMLLDTLNRTHTIMQDGRLNPERSSTVHLALVGKGGPQKFVFRDFDYDAFAETIKDDIAWLEAFTGGEISFDLAPKDEADPDLALDLSGVAEALNSQALLAESEALKARMFKAMWEFETSAGDARETARQALQTAIAQGTDAQTLTDMGEPLRRSSLREMVPLLIARVREITAHPQTLKACDALEAAMQEG